MSSLEEVISSKSTTRKLAIIGMSCHLPGIENICDLWQHIIGASKKSASASISLQLQLVSTVLAALKNVWLSSDSKLQLHLVCPPELRLQESEIAFLKESLSRELQFAEFQLSVSSESNTFAAALKKAEESLYSKMETDIICQFHASPQGTSISTLALRAFDKAFTKHDTIFATISAYNSFDFANDVSWTNLRSIYDASGFAASTTELQLLHASDSQLAKCLSELDKTISDKSNCNDILPYGSLPWCAITHIDSLFSEGELSSAVAVIVATLSLHHRVLPQTVLSTINSATLYPNTETRPWIHPIYKTDCLYKRRAGVTSINEREASHFVLEEFIHEDEMQTPSFWHEWSSELCLFESDSEPELHRELQALINTLAENTRIPLKDVAFSLNQKVQQRQESAISPKVRLAVIARDSEDLLAKLFELNTSFSMKDRSDSSGVYLAAGNDNTGGLAYLLPGLGAAYPNMLADLCMYFPEARYAFDYIDNLAVKMQAGYLPSQKIMPPPYAFGRKFNSTSAEIATMDSSVIVVLLAEYALFSILSKLGLQPTCVMGASTGEYAALVISGSVDLLEAAPNFYKQSMSVARSVPIESLTQLKSLMVQACWDDISKELSELSIYLTADLSPRQCIITGQQEVSKQAMSILRSKQIAVHSLPAAIPYHTPLVEKSLGTEPEELRSVRLLAPQIKSWACSTCDVYPNNPEHIFSVASTLFRHPIKFRQTLEAMYKDGVRTFVEIGPRDGLTQLVGEVLAGKPHTALASNISGKDSLLQLHHLLAKLFISGFQIDLNYLHARRDPRIIGFFEACAALPQLEPASSPENFDDLVVSNFLDTIATFHKNIMEVQKNVHTAYFANASENQVITISSSLIAREFEELYPLLPTNCRSSCVILNKKAAFKHDISSMQWQEQWLTVEERKYFASDAKTQKRKLEWLYGRICAKESLQILARKVCNIELSPLDIEINYDGNGHPLVCGNFASKTNMRALISVAHADGSAIALACLPDHNCLPGIDMEPARSRGAAFEEMAFTKAELELVSSLLDREEALTRIWCAKEALVKTGLLKSLPPPSQLQVVQMDPAGQIIVRGKIAGQENDSHFLVHSLCHDDLIITACVGEFLPG